MKFCITFLSIVFLIYFTAMAQEKTVDIKSFDDLVLKGTLYSSTKPGPGVILLHQCNRNRSTYENLARMLSQAGIAALTLDFRGYGESPTDFSGRSVWPKDVEAAFTFLTTQQNVVGNIGVLGASCGGNPAVMLTNKHDSIKTLVLFSSSLRGLDSEEEKSLLSYSNPILTIYSTGDGSVSTKMEKITPHFQNSKSKVLQYEGYAHGTPLFQKDKTLEKQIVEWFGIHL